MLNMNIFKEFFLYIKMIKAYQKIDLADEHKIILEAFDKTILEVISNKANENIIKEGLQNNLSLDYIKWYKHAISHFISYFRKYK